MLLPAMTFNSRAQAHGWSTWYREVPPHILGSSVCGGDVLRTDIVLLKPNTEQEKRLFRLPTESSLLWNQANYERRQAFFKNKTMSSYAKQCNTLKHSEHFKALGTGKGQAILSKLHESWQSFWQLKKMQKQGLLPQHIAKVSPPKYWKDRNTKESEIKMFCIRNRPMHHWRHSDWSQIYLAEKWW